MACGCRDLGCLGTNRILKSSAYKEFDYKRDAQGKIILLDTPRMRADAAFAYDQTIAMEKRGHKLSNGMSWNEDWLRTIRSIRRNTENPEWYVQYIIEQRRKAGLPELEGVDEA
ncbi:MULTISPECIES: hypothetical protein [unclassified Paenibacillus]|uniref:hypothetical protein n=1 Tax=unclassified Paenibacillus TaxID=185978 RepID=UPI001CD94EB7|nr:MULTISPECIES: hypothetical protein [Paenibacillaceae]